MIPSLVGVGDVDEDSSTSVALLAVLSSKTFSMLYFLYDQNRSRILNKFHFNFPIEKEVLFNLPY